MWYFAFKIDEMIHWFFLLWKLESENFEHLNVDITLKCRNLYIEFSGNWYNSFLWTDTKLTKGDCPISLFHFICFQRASSNTFFSWCSLPFSHLFLCLTFCSGAFTLAFYSNNLQCHLTCWCFFLFKIILILRLSYKKINELSFFV